MTTLPTRQQIEDAGALEFAQPKTKRQRGVTIQLTYHGALVSFNFSAADNVPIAELEQSIDTLLRREGWSSTTSSATAPALNGPGKSKAQYVDPIYDTDGAPCCPTHRKPLKQGNYGLYCSAKANVDRGDTANDKGYCALRFRE